jgi:hypothetical protein
MPVFDKPTPILIIGHSYDERHPHTEPDGVARGQEGGERNKGQHRGQSGQDDGARPLDGGLDNRMI